MIYQIGKEIDAYFTILKGEDEMTALNNGVLREIRGEEKAKIYEDEVRI